MKIDQFPAFSYVLLTVLVFSLYPSIMILGAAQTGPVTFVFLSQFFAAVAGLIFTAAFVIRNNLLDAAAKALQTLQIEQYIFIILVGLCCTVTNVFFIYAAMMMDRAGAAVIYDTWPVLAMFLTPMVVRKDWQKTGARHVLLAIIALVGIALIAVADQKSIIREEGELDVTALIGAILAVMGSFTLALFYAMRLQVSNYLNMHADFLKGRPVSQAAVGEFISRVAGLPFAIVFLFLFPESPGGVPAQGVLWGIVLGFGVLFLGNCAYVIGLLKAASPSMHILWYMVPVLAVVWLWALGLAEINLLIACGAGLVILTNILLEIDRRRQARKAATT